MLDLTDFAVQERPEGNLMVASSRPWYNCSYTMAAKPIKSLELHYTMMQFLIKRVIDGVALDLSIVACICNLKNQDSVQRGISGFKKCCKRCSFHTLLESTA